MIYRLTDNNREDFDGMMWHAGIPWRLIEHDADAGVMTVEIDAVAGYQTAWLDRGDDYDFRISFLSDRIELAERGHDYRAEDCG